MALDESCTRYHSWYISLVHPSNILLPSGNQFEVTDSCLHTFETFSLITHRHIEHTDSWLTVICLIQATDCIVVKCFCCKLFTISVILMSSSVFECLIQDNCLHTFGKFYPNIKIQFRHVEKVYRKVLLAISYSLLDKSSGQFWY